MRQMIHRKYDFIRVPRYFYRNIQKQKTRNSVHDFISSPFPDGQTLFRPKVDYLGSIIFVWFSETGYLSSFFVKCGKIFIFFKDILDLDKKILFLFILLFKKNKILEKNLRKKNYFRILQHNMYTN